LYVLHQGKLSAQGSPRTFNVKPLPGDSPDLDFQSVATFQQQTSNLLRETSLARKNLDEAEERLRYMEAALPRTPRITEAHFAEFERLEKQLAELQMRLMGDPILQQKNESVSPSITSRVGGVAYGHWDTRQAPTATQKAQIESATRDYQAYKGDLKSFMDDLEAFQTDLQKAGAPWTPGQKLN
jgi:hypothetical protein